MLLGRVLEFKLTAVYVPCLDISKESVSLHAVNIVSTLGRQMEHASLKTGSKVLDP